MLLLAVLGTGPFALAEVPIDGRWQIDRDHSTDPEEVLDGIRKSKRIIRDDETASPARTPGSGTERRYWEEANAGNEWRHTHELAYAGPLQRLLESENLEIVVDNDGYLFIYADGFERPVVPNPGGRVFTASGEELVQTEIGFTLAFWEDDTLVMETRIKHGGKLTEKLSTSADGNTLTVTIAIDRRDWKWIAKLDRVFHRVTAD